MSKFFSIALIAVLVLGGGYMIMGHYVPEMAWAQGWGMMGGGNGGGYYGRGGCPMSFQGSPGGQDFRPLPNQGYNQGFNQGPGLTQERAKDIIGGFLARLNPSLQADNGVDVGNAYEFEIRSGDKTVDRMAVDKSTGQVRPVQ